jgi:hypothetical protein
VYDRSRAATEGGKSLYLTPPGARSKRARRFPFGAIFVSTGRSLGSMVSPISGCHRIFVTCCGREYFTMRKEP